MPPKFGTSGLRGLVTELTPSLVADHVRAFALTCPMGTGLFVAFDLRASSPAIAQMVAQAGRAAGLQVTMCGPIPTPALAQAAMAALAKRSNLLWMAQLIQPAIDLPVLLRSLSAGAVATAD